MFVNAGVQRHCWCCCRLCCCLPSSKQSPPPLPSKSQSKNPSHNRQIVCTKLFVFNHRQRRQHRIMSRNILHWSYRDFRNFPDDLLEHRESVEEIYLKENFIPSLPKWLFDFVNLRFIHLGGNLLEHIPDEICLLQCLEFLDVSKNRIAQLPRTFRRMSRLKRFNACDNLLTVLPAEIGEIALLETLDVSKNQLDRLPVELAQCQLLNELLVNDNRIAFIPNRIINLPRLEVLEADRCCLQYLPGTVGRMLTHVRVFNNTRLTHYPVIYERFLRLHYDYWSENVVSADQMMVFLPDQSENTIMPHGMAHVHGHSCRMPATLVELGLRNLSADEEYYKRVCELLRRTEGGAAGGVLPGDIGARLANGPTTVCGREGCSVPLFTECYFLLLKKNRSSSHIIFSNMFCSMDCTLTWLILNGGMYHMINWATLRQQ